MTEPAVKVRLSAILAADAVGFSRLMSANEHTTLAALDAARTLFRAHIEHDHGRVIDMAGDSVLAVFETAAGAVRAALAVQQSIASASEHVAPDVRMLFRIGVHLGDVIEKDDGTIYGEGVNVAARLEALARPGGITVSDAVHGVVRGRIDATFTDQGEQQLKNIARPVRAYALDLPGDASEAAAGTAAPAVASPAPAPRSPHREASLFVGRQQEMAHLTSALASARQGRGQVVLLAGSGGMGKTRLAQQLAQRAEGEGVLVLWGRCLEEPGAPLYWPWRQLIRAYLRTSGDPHAAQTFGAGLADIAGIVPELAEQFPVEPAGAQASDTAQSRFRLFDAVVAFWRRAAERVPQLLIFEDLHWADATSLRLFAFLAAELEDSGVMVVGTYRDTELSRQHPLFDTLAELARSSSFRRIELTGLSSRETEEFMAAASGGVASTGFVAAIHARTEGHPLFLEETLRLIVDGQAARTVGSARDDLQKLLKIPSGVREVIGKRLNRLSPSTGRLLAIAACIGRTFELDILAELEADKSEDDVLLALEEALAAHLIDAVPQTQQFRFSHALIRETLYDEMLGMRRARLHLRIGEMLEQRHGTDDATILPQLAYHFSEAGPGAAAKALAYAERSAEQAAGLLAFEEAVRLYGLALRLQQRHAAKDAALRCGLLLALGDIQALLGAGEPASAAYQQAAELARSNGLAEPFARAAIGFERSNVFAARSGEPAVALLLEAIAMHRADDATRVDLLSRLCRAYIYCGRVEEAKEAHARAVALARRIGDVDALYVALASMTSAAFYWPDLLPQCLADAKEAWSIAEGRALALPIVDVLPYFLAHLFAVGDTPGVRRLIGQGLRLAEQTRLPYLQTLCRHAEALVAINEGRFTDAEACAMQALESGRRLADDQAVTTYGMQMFCLRREQGRLREALPMLQHFVQTTPSGQIWQPGLALLYAELDMRVECRAQFDNLAWSRVSRAPRDSGSLTVIVFAAEACVYLEDAARAAQLHPWLLAYEGIAPIVDFGGPCLGSMDRLLGKLDTVLERWQAAERHFEAALALDQQSGSRVWLAHSRYAYASMLHRRAGPGDLDRARALLGDALAESTVLGMNALTPRIEALAGAIAAPPPAYPCGLTEREVGVLRLMAIGRNNREIGQVLAISPNTVANHVRSILEKTYTANRTEAAAFANREGLLKS